MDSWGEKEDTKLNKVESNGTVIDKTVRISQFGF